ncbi:putative porin [Sulfurovum sp. zt1-1]|uniref:Porin n=1 Tax=Sulfurovum zhangzhouensis TaxID=3019067 RepID=A0ABT7QXH7_9BACT|nr:putative porin [Sulfurovum zhangzhouensis]MDM5271535.1 putative porin [Sulfurovum zhangzhouensis]
MKKIVLSLVALATILTASETEEVSSSESSFLDRIHFKGDMRLRYESIERDDKSNTYRTRYRLRLFTDIDLADNLLLETAVISGKDNPTSGNVTFRDDEPWSDYFFDVLELKILDIAYKFDNSTIKAGKQAYMMYRPIKSQLVWDNDVLLEGVNYNYTDNTNMVTLGVNQLHRRENEATSTGDINLFLAQYVLSTKLESSTLNIGAGFYYYDGIKGNSTPYAAGALGNTLVSGFYANDYHILEGFGELKFKDVLGKPFEIAASVAYNTAADDNNFGYDIGVQLGKAKNIGEWQVKYSYTDIEADAVFAAHSDSDNFGGGSAAKGHAIRTKYVFSKHVDIAGTFFFNTLYASKSATGVEADYERVQLDAIIKF